MSTPLTCPGCKSPIPVPIGFAEPVIRCGICWTAVPFEASETPAPPLLAVPVVDAVVVEPSAPVAAAVPAGAPAEMARLEAILTAADTRIRPAPRRAKAITVTPATAIIPPPLDALPVVTPRRATRTVPAMSSDPPPKPRYRPRDEDEDEDDTPAQRPSRTGALVAALLAAGVLLVGLAVGGFFLLTSVFGDKPTDVAANGDGNQAAAPPLQFELPQENEPNNRQPNRGMPRGNKRGQNPPPPPLAQFGGPQIAEPPAIPPQPQFGGPVAGVRPPALPDPPAFGNRGGMAPPQPQRPADPEWEQVAGTDGFTVQMPGRPNPGDHWLHVHRRDGGKLDFTQANGKKWSMNDRGYRFEAEYVVLPDGFTPDITRTVSLGRPVDTRPTTVNGRAGEEISIPFGPAPEVKRAVFVGRRLYVFTTHLHPLFGRDAGHANAARERFHDSIKFAADGEQAPPPNNPPAGDRMPTTGSATHKLPAFTAAVVLPKKGEVLTFGTRFNNRGVPAGEVRRYSYPGFAPRATYYIVHPVSEAVYDEATDRVLVAAVSNSNFGFVPGDRSVVSGLVQVYDVGRLTGGTLADRDEVKADAALTLPGGPTWVAGLAAATGKGLVLTLNASPNSRSFRGRLHQFDPSTGKLLQSLDLPDPAWRLAVSPDGARAYTSSVILQPGPVPVPAPTEGGYVQTIDIPAWKKDRSIQLPGMVFDLSLTRDGRPLAALTTGRVFALPSGRGEAVELGTLPPVPTATTAEYATVTPDGRKLVVSRYGGFGVRVMSIDKWDGPAGLTPSASYDRLLVADRPGTDTPVGGYFHLTPDGKFALFRNGLVLPVNR